MQSRYAYLAPATLMLCLAGCGDSATLPVEAGYGPAPSLPEPNKTLIPTVHIAKAIGWPDGGKPQAAAGLQVHAFADGLDHPRWLYVLPNGDVLVAESDAPPKPDGSSQGIRGWVMKRSWPGRDPGARAPTASRCYATAMATGSWSSARPFSRD